MLSISKKYFLKGKTLGITEYLAKKTRTNKVAMLIFNEDLSVSPLTTHIALKDVHKTISKKKITIHPGSETFDAGAMSISYK